MRDVFVNKNKNFLFETKKCIVRNLDHNPITNLVLDPSLVRGRARAPHRLLQALQANSTVSGTKMASGDVSLKNSMKNVWPLLRGVVDAARPNPHRLLQQDDAVALQPRHGVTLLTQKKKIPVYWKKLSNKRVDAVRVDAVIGK